MNATLTRFLSNETVTFNWNGKNVIAKKKLKHFTTLEMLHFKHCTVCHVRYVFCVRKGRYNRYLKVLKLFSVAIFVFRTCSDVHRGAMSPREWLRDNGKRQQAKARLETERAQKTERSRSMRGWERRPFGTVYQCPSPPLMQNLRGSLNNCGDFIANNVVFFKQIIIALGTTIWVLKLVWGHKGVNKK